MKYEKTLFTVGQFAEFNNVSAQTLRYYDQIGLLRPHTFNEQTGYRYYRITQCATLDYINHLKALGISLKDIKRFLENGDTAWLMKTLSDKQDAVDEEMSRLLDIKSVLSRRLNSYYYQECIPKSGFPFIEAAHERTIFKYDTGVNYYYNEESLANYEYMLHIFRDKLSEQKVPSAYYCNVSSIMPMENLLSHSFKTTELFVFVNDSDSDRFDSCETIDAGLNLCIICSDASREVEYIDLLLKEAEEKQYTICGNYICETVNEFLSPDGERAMVLKLQIPIKF